MIFTQKNKEFAILGITLDEIRGKWVNFITNIKTDNIFGALTSLFSSKKNNVLTLDVLSQFEEFKEKFNTSRLSADALAEKLKNVDQNIIDYAKTCKNGEMTTNGFKESINSMSLSAKAGTAMFKALSIAGNMIAFAVISKGISFAVQGIDNYIHRVENTIKKGKEAQNQINSLSDTFKNNENSAKSLAGSYDKLAKNVTDVSNADLDLSSDEYKEFVEVNQNILDLFPSLNRVYDTNGNAMVKLKDSTQSLSEVLANLLEIQRKSTFKEMADKLPEAFDGTLAEVGGLKEQLDYTNAQRNLIDSIQFDENGIFTLDVTSQDDAEPYRDLLDIAGVNYSESQNFDESTAIPVWRITVRANDLEIDGEDSRSPADIINERLNEELGVLQLDQTGLEQKIKDSWGNLNESLYAYMSTENARFMAMSDQKQHAVQHMLSGIDWSDIDGIDGWTDAQNYINNNIMQWMSDLDISSKLTELFTIDKSQISTKDYIELVDDICREISEKSGREPAQIKAELGLEENYDSLTRDRQGFLNRMDGTDRGEESKSAAVNFYDGLTSSERDIANSKDFENAVKNRERTLGHLITTVDDYNAILSSIESSENKPSFTKSDMIDSMNQLSDGLNVLNDIYTYISENSTGEGQIFDLSKLNTKQFGETFQEVKDEYTEFIETVTSNPSNIKACQKSFNNLTMAYISQSEALSNLNQENAGVAANMLSNLGIKNAEDLIQKKLIANEQTLCNKEIALAASSDVLSGNIKDVSCELFNEANMSSLAKIQLADLVAQEQIFESQDLMTTSKVDELNNLAQAYFGVSNAIEVSSAMGADPRYWNNPEDFGKEVQKQWDDFINEQQAKEYEFEFAGKKKEESDDSSNEPDIKPEIKPAKTEINWLERRLTNMQNIIDLTASKLQNLFSVKDKRNNLTEQIKQTTKQIKQYEKAADRYMKKAKKVAKSSTVKEDGKKKKVPALSKDVINKIQSGEITKQSYKKLIKEYDKDYADKINSYIDYYDKSLNAEKNAEDSKAKKRQQKKDKIQVKIDDYESNVELLEQQKNNDSTASGKNGYLEKEKALYNNIYDKKIKIAKLDKDDTEVQRLKAEQDGKIKEIQIEQHQNNIDEYESDLDLLSAQKENATTAAQKNEIVDKELETTSQIIAQKKNIADLEGDTDESSRLDEELKTAKKQAIIEKSGYITDEYNNKLEAIDRDKSSLDARLKKHEALGLGQSRDDYTEQIDLSKRRQQELENKKKSLEAYLKEQIELGNIVEDESDPAYKALMDSISECNTGIGDCVTEQINYNKAIKDMDLKNYESLISLLERGGDVYKRYKSLADIHGSELSDDEIYKQIELNDRIINTARAANEERANNIKKALINDYTDAFGFNFTEEQADQFIEMLKNAPELIPDFMKSLGIEDFNEELFKDLFKDINDFCTQEDVIFQKMGDNENLVDELYGKRMNWINEYLDALKKEKDIKDRTFAIEKAQYELNKAKNNLTKKVWDGQQWVYTADTEAVQSAQEAYDNAQYEELVNVLENLIDFLESFQKDINMYDDHGNEINTIGDIKKENEKNKTFHEIDKIFKDNGIDFNKIDSEKVLSHLKQFSPSLSFNTPNFEVPGFNNQSNNNSMNIQKIELILPNVTNSSAAEDLVQGLVNELSSLGTYAKQYDWKK